MDGRKILIVEDEMVTALDLRTELCRLGYEVTGLAKSGEEAMRLTEESNPDLILMDITLKGSIDGVEASKRIRELAPVPIVYLTANPNIFLQNPADMQRPYMCISKPFAICDLQAVINIALAPKATVAPIS